MHYCLYCSKNSIILTKHDYSHDRVGTCSSSTDPSRRPREPSKASSWNLRSVQPPRRVRKPPRRVRGGALEAPRSLLEDTLREGFAEPSWRLREGFAKAPRAPPFGNDSSDNDKPPGGNWSRETDSAVPSRVSLLISILRLNLVLTYGIPPEFRGGVQLWNRHTLSGQSRVYRVTQLRTDDVHCRESAGTGPVNLKVVPNECCLGRSPCVCVCVFFPFILDIKFVGRTSRGHTGGRSHRISHPPSFCGACPYFSREKDSAISFPRRLWNRILCTNDLIVLHPLGIFI